MQSAPSREREFVLRLSCRDTRGIVHAVSALPFQAGCNIIDSQQFGDLIGPGATGQLIGATAHHVTADLDEGTIIEQDVERVDPSRSDRGGPLR